MTSNPPDEAIHFRGKTLTPESPRPLHIPEPSNIPVLENQMDPIFNDTSTYEKLSAYQDDERPSQLELDSEIYKSTNEDENRLREVLLSVAQASETANVPSTLGAQSAAAHLPLSDESNVAPYHQMSEPISADPVNNSTTALESSLVNPGTGDIPSKNAAAETGVDFQDLLDNTSPSASTAPSGPVVTAITSSPADNPGFQEPQQSVLPPKQDHNYALSAGLPPRPPTQEVPNLNPNYLSTENNSEYYPVGAQTSNMSLQISQPQVQDQYSDVSRFAPGVVPGTTSGSNGLRPPPVASFQQPNTVQDVSAQPNHKSLRPERYGARSGNSPDDEAFWGSEVQKIYDEFLREERVYVTEGLWDRFPYGSRLFVGNLPSERVTKRDLFHVFHKYGKLAQISIKQAYGFIQFLDADSCHRALQAEQGGVVRGRKIHLEISKPQKSTRPGANHPESARQSLTRRSRSPPDYTRGGPSNSRGARNQGSDRHDRPYETKRGSFGDFRDEHGPRRRDDYRPPRSPSPRSFRNRDSGFLSRNRTPDRFERRDRRRSRSPYSRDRRHRSPSPRGRSGYDGESESASSRRAPRDVPDLQILAADDVDMSFAYHVENSFKTRGLRTNILVLSRIPMDVAIQRQMEEGVFAVIKLTRSQQFSGKVTLLIFDRTTGASSKPRSIEYPDLDLHVAVEMTVQMHTLRRAGTAPNFYPHNPSYPLPLPLPNQFPQPIPLVQPGTGALPQTNQIANLIQGLDGPALQSLLNTLQQAQSVPQAAVPSMPMATNGSHQVDLASLLSNAHRQQTLATAQNQGSQSRAPNPFGLPQLSNGPDPNLLALLAKGSANGNSIQGGQAPVGPHMQNIVNQLAKWKQ
ncbi:RNA-binding protein (Nab3), putative [Talaromyces stipitatus ATCC 10500]|uniref:RNA-binding protein (Nab3), putative n=1 Tax=Talaromyces stipitatus (strain ATCC 10500 / CBS 375.48 / QM 6759 / NRRL 1006) TaxID=441959 RepID=B8LUT5_TALSN|nr:RNA-binding protein (Nab3), putative [Talaromyces stipitatus ATCC 10500]EED23942.1 RNA-binding protein (Nab3), putative [Talaromyces stipitatus ATCC 10500]